MNTVLSSKQIFGYTLDQDAKKRLRQQFDMKGLAKDDHIVLSIFEVTVHGTTRYCCWAGGQLVAPPAGKEGPPLPSLTPAGQVTVETMIDLPFFRRRISFVQLVQGPTPIATKVAEAFSMTPEDMMLCFFGDLSGELTGVMHKTMNITALIDVKDCVGIPTPSPITLQ